MGVAVPPFLVQNPFVLGAGDGPPRPHADPDSSPMAHRRRVRRHYGHDCDGNPEQHVPVHGQRRRRHDVAVRLHVGELQQQCVGDLQAHGRPGVVRSHEHDAGALVVRQIVGERADRLPDPAGIVSSQGFLALDQIGLQVGQHGFELAPRIRGSHSRAPPWGRTAHQAERAEYGASSSRTRTRDRCRRRTIRVTDAILAEGSRIEPHAFRGLAHVARRQSFEHFRCVEPTRLDAGEGKELDPQLPRTRAPVQPPQLPHPHRAVAFGLAFVRARDLGLDHQIGGGALEEGVGGHLSVGEGREIARGALADVERAVGLESRCREARPGRAGGGCAVSSTRRSGGFRRRPRRRRRPRSGPRGGARAPSG